MEGRACHGLPRVRISEPPWWVLWQRGLCVQPCCTRRAQPRPRQLCHCHPRRSLQSWVAPQCWHVRFELLGKKKRSKTPHCNVELGKDRRCPTWKKKASLYISGALEPSGSCGGGGLFFSSKFALSHLRSFSSKPLHFSLLDLDSQSREDPTGYRSYFLLKVILGGASMPDKPHIL